MSKTRLKALQNEAQGVVKTAREIAEKARSEGREMTAEEASVYQEAMSKGNALLGQIESVKRDIDVMESADDFARQVGRPLAPGQEPGAAVDGKGFLGFGRKTRNMAERIAAGMVRDNGTGAKALMPAGSVVTGVPLLAESPIALGQLPLSLLDVVPTVQRNPHYSYLRQTTRTNNAAPVAIGGTKPASVLGLENVEAGLEIIAHLSEPIHSYWLTDNGNLETFVGNELLYGLRVALENQFLNGTGTSPQLDGVLTTSGIQTQAFATDLLTTTRQAITKLETAGHEAGVFALSPADWEALELARTDTAGNLELGGPVDRAARKLWGVPVVVSTQLGTKTGVLLDLATVGISTDTNGIETKWSENVADDFSKNQLRARVEGRFQADVFQPQGVVKIATAAA